MKLNTSLFLVVCLFKFSLQLFGTVERITPKGFRIKSPIYFIDDRISHVVFYVNINQTFEDYAHADFKATITEKTDGLWVYDNVNVHIETNTRIYHNIEVFHHNFNNTAKGNINEVKMDVITPKTSEVDIAQPTKEKCVDVCKILDKCELSVTTVKRRPVCKGELIFEENFNDLDSKKWKIDARIPSNDEDSPFVSFQRSAIFTKNGMLHIKPKYLWKTSGFNRSSIRTGSLNVANCSGGANECSRRAHFSQILPPIISGKIRTRESFSFRYGKVVIRAKMPEGDWLLPQLLLEPLENFYGSTEYMSGQMRIASLRGNRFLQTIEGKDISNKMITGGVVLENRGPMHDINLRHQQSNESVSADFHNFTLTWTEEDIQVEIDDDLYGIIKGGFSRMYGEQSLKNKNIWENSHLMAPFDREFFITIALSVGGHGDFPDGCKSDEDDHAKPWRNDDPKALLNFWEDRDSWLPTWIASKSELEIDYIHVYAL